MVTEYQVVETPLELALGDVATTSPRVLVSVRVVQFPYLEVVVDVLDPELLR